MLDRYDEKDENFGSRWWFVNRSMNELHYWNRYSGGMVGVVEDINRSSIDEFLWKLQVRYVNFDGQIANANMSKLRHRW